MRVLVPLIGGFLLAVAGYAQDKIEVAFQFESATATNVAVVGEFSRGRPVAMQHDAPGGWTCRLAIKPGTYAYKFLIDGTTWEFDPTNPARKQIGDFEYSALTVGEARRSPPPVGKPLIALEVVPAKNTRNTGSGYSYDDEQTQNVQMEVTVRSREMQRDHRGLSGELYVFARDMRNTREYKLILHETKTFDLPIRETVQYKSEMAKLTFDRQGTYKWGFKYYGYLYMLRDVNNDVVMTESVPDKLFEKLDTFRDKQINETFGM